MFKKVNMDIDCNNKYKRIEVKLRTDKGSTDIIEFKDCNINITNNFMIIEQDFGEFRIRGTIINLEKIIEYQKYKD